MHFPWAQTPGVRHSFTSVGERSKMASWPLSFTQSPLSGLGHLNDEAGQSVFRGGMGHPGKAVRLFLLLAPPTEGGQGPFPPEPTAALVTRSTLRMS